MTASSSFFAIDFERSPMHAPLRVGGATARIARHIIRTTSPPHNKWSTPMKLRFPGTLDDLRAAVASLHLRGSWAELTNGVWKFTRDDRAGLLWSSTQGTLWFDGPAPACQRLSQLVAAALSEAQNEKSRASGRIVFVVGGHAESRDEVERVLEQLGIESYTSKVIGGGAPLIDVLEGMSGTRGEAAFGIVLLETEESVSRISPGKYTGRPPCVRRRGSRSRHAHVRVEAP
jgi:hypothetical protein